MGSRVGRAQGMPGQRPQDLSVSQPPPAVDNDGGEREWKLKISAGSVPAKMEVEMDRCPAPWALSMALLRGVPWLHAKLGER